MEQQRPRFDERHPGDRWVVVGAALFGIGLLATLSTVVPLFLAADPLPTGFYVAALLAPVGLGLALAGMLRGNRARRSATAHRPPVRAGRRG